MVEIIKELVEILPSEIKNLPEIFRLTQACSSHLQSQDIQQWDETYPSLELLERDINSGAMFSLFESTELIGMIVMDDIQSSQYKSIDWQLKEKPILVVHRLAIAPQHQGKQLGLHLMQYAEGMAKSGGYKSIRLDAYKHNPKLQQFYIALGYISVGEIDLEYTTGPFVCFEKAV